MRLTYLIVKHVHQSLFISQYWHTCMNVPIDCRDSRGYSMSPFSFDECPVMKTSLVLPANWFKLN